VKLLLNYMPMTLQRVLLLKSEFSHNVKLAIIMNRSSLNVFQFLYTSVQRNSIQQITLNEHQQILTFVQNILYETSTCIIWRNGTENDKLQIPSVLPRQKRVRAPEYRSQWWQVITPASLHNAERTEERERERLVRRNQTHTTGRSSPNITLNANGRHVVAMSIVLKWMERIVSYTETGAEMEALSAHLESECKGWLRWVHNLYTLNMNNGLIVYCVSNETGLIPLKNTRPYVPVHPSFRPYFAAYG
jgi:hypothetical protein